MSLKEIGDKYQLTKERIRQIEKKAIKRLQHPTRSHLLKSYVLN
jgi:RNA polymerase primary sigma factor